MNNNRKKGNEKAVISSQTVPLTVSQEKLRKQKTITSIICLSSLLMIVFSLFAAMMDWPLGSMLSLLGIFASVFFCSLIILINQSVEYSKYKKMDNKNVTSALLYSGYDRKIKDGSANSIVSLICALVPAVLYVWYLVDFLGSPCRNVDPFGWIFAIYYWTVGIPLFVVWLVCGIFGLNSRKSKLAIVSLLIKPIGLLIIFSIISLSRALCVAQ